MQFSTGSWTTFKGKRPHIQFATEIGLLNSKGFLRYDNSNPNRIIIHNGNHEIGEILCTPTNRIDLK